MIRVMAIAHKLDGSKSRIMTLNQTKLLHAILEHNYGLHQCQHNTIMKCCKYDERWVIRPHDMCAIDANDTTLSCLLYR